MHGPDQDGNPVKFIPYLDYVGFQAIFFEHTLMGSKGVLMKKITPVFTLMALLIWSFLASAAEVNKEAKTSPSINQALHEIMKYQGVNEIKSIDCSKVTEKQLESLGEALMDVMHPDSSEHGFMDRMMGGEGSQTLESMHRIMGARYLGCYEIERSFGMMYPFWGENDNVARVDYNRRWGWQHRPMMYGYGPWGMMGGYGGVIMWVLFLVVIVLVIYLIMKRARPAGAGETPLDILKKRYAKGEITKEEFEQMRKDLGF